MLRALAIGLAIAAVIYVLSGGHFLFLPFLFVPFLFGGGGRRRGGRRMTYGTWPGRRRTRTW